MIKDTTHRMVERLRSNGSLFYVIIFLFAMFHVLFTILDYDKCWVAQEVWRRHIPQSLKYGTALRWADFPRCFEVLSFEQGDNRVRFLSYLVELFNIKFRVWLFNYLPPHPSLSLTWLFSLVLSPILLFKLIYNLTSSRRASWIALSLYFLSTGFLSGITELFHPGKPLTCFFAIFCFYLASKINLYLTGGEKFTKKFFCLYLLLIVVMFAAFFADETAWFIFIAVPVLFPVLFAAKKRRVAIIGLYLLPLVCFLVVVTFLAPTLVQKHGFDRPFNFWGYMLKNNDEPNFTVWEKFSLRNVILNAKNLFSSQMLPWQTREWKDRLSRPIIDWGRPFWVIVSLLLFAYFLYLFKILPPAGKKLLLRTVAVLILFILFQSLVMAKHELVLLFPYYYGSLFSLFWVFPLSILLSSPEKKKLKNINKIILLFILAILTYNFIKINQFSEEQNYGKETRLTFPMVWEAWRNRDNVKTLFQMRARYPVTSYWLFRELDYISLWGGDLLRSENVILTASSQNRPVKNLIDNNPETFWLIAPARAGKPAWVSVDFGEGNKKAVRFLAARPRIDFSNQFFRKAKLFGSDDGRNWEPVAPIGQAKNPWTNKWIKWLVDNNRAFRHYKLLIFDGHADGSARNFYSMAELAMFE